VKECIRQKKYEPSKTRKCHIIFWCFSRADAASWVSKAKDKILLPDLPFELRPDGCCWRRLTADAELAAAKVAEAARAFSFAEGCRTVRGVSVLSGQGRVGGQWALTTLLAAATSMAGTDNSDTVAAAAVAAAALTADAQQP
jgi:hypothetical protein